MSTTKDSSHANPPLPPLNKMGVHCNEDSVNTFAFFVYDDDDDDDGDDYYAWNEYLRNIYL